MANYSAHVTSISINLSNLLIDQISLMLIQENTRMVENTCVFLFVRHSGAAMRTLFLSKQTNFPNLSVVKIQVPKQKC